MLMLAAIFLAWEAVEGHLGFSRNELKGDDKIIAGKAKHAG